MKKWIHPQELETQNVHSQVNRTNKVVANTERSTRNTQAVEKFKKLYPKAYEVLGQ